MKFDNIIIDASSIINFFRYYYNFVNNNYKDKKVIFEGLKEFLIEK